MARRRILVVEDEFLLACLLEEDLREFDYEVVGPFNDLAAALASLQREKVDAALLDVNLNGTMVFPLADELVARGVPIVFLTGYGRGLIPQHLANYAVIAKPSEPSMIDREIRRAIAAAR